MYTPTHLDMQSVQGTLLSVLFILLAKFFEVISITEFLQGSAYFATIIVAIDTLSGNQIKKFLINKFNNASNSKRTKLNKKV